MPDTTESPTTKLARQQALHRAQEFVADCMDDILRRFKKGAKITVLVRTPGLPDADFCMTSDDMAEVADMVVRRREAGYDR